MARYDEIADNEEMWEEALYHEFRDPRHMFEDMTHGEKIKLLTELYGEEHIEEEGMNTVTVSGELVKVMSSNGKYWMGSVEVPSGEWTTKVTVRAFAPVCVDCGLLDVGDNVSFSGQLNNFKTNRLDARGKPIWEMNVRADSVNGGSQ